MKQPFCTFCLTAVLLGCAALAASADDGVANGVAINPNYSPDIEKIQEGVSDVQAGQNSNDPDEVLEASATSSAGWVLAAIVNCSPPQSEPAQIPRKAGRRRSHQQVVAATGQHRQHGITGRRPSRGPASNLVRNHTSH